MTMNKCLDCGHVQSHNDVQTDKMGDYMICEECESSFDVN